MSYFVCQAEAFMVEQIAAATDTMLGGVFEVLPMGVVTVAVNGRVSYVNNRFSALTGIVQSQVVGGSLTRLDDLLEACCDPAYPFLRCTVFEHGQPCANDIAICAGDSQTLSNCAGCQLVLLQPHRRLRRTVRMLNDSSSALRAIVFFEDVTRELQLDIMKSEFLIAAAHELRTPMTMIHGYAELMLLSELSESDANRMLRTLYRNAKSMCLVLDDLLELAKIEDMAGNAMKFEQLDLGQVVLQACGSFDAGNDSRRPSVNLDIKPAQILGNFDQLEKTLHQILSNAYKYSFGRAGIDIRVCSSPTANWLRVTIADHGIGMTAADVGMAFVRFWRADKSGKVSGSGLGLSFVHRVVNLHKGRVEIVSEPGAGTTVILDFPAE
jgi:signal transduction histidine kinase